MKRIIAVVGLISFIACRAAAGEWQAWWDAAWPARLVVEVVAPEARGGINTAVVSPAEECARFSHEGADARVVSQSGKVVPHAIIPKGEGRFDIEFLLAEPAETRYYIYYGNPKAEAARHVWERKLGGLTLATYPSIPGFRVWEWQSFCAAYAKRGKPYGSEPWGYIDDVTNPFGQDEFYLSVYSGKFFCPVSGKYQIATNSDDSSFVFIDYEPSFTPKDAEKIVVWRHDGVPSDDWADPEYRQAIRTVELSRGVHTVWYLHAENGGKQLARLGWKTPQDDEIHTVPPEAFVSRIPAEIIARQEAGRAVNPYFTYQHRYSLSVNNDPSAVIPVIYLIDRTTVLPPASGSEQPPATLARRWLLPDGRESGEPEMLTELTGGAGSEVALEVAWEGGSARVSRKIELGGGLPRPLSVFFQMDIAHDLIPAGAALPVKLQFRCLTQRPRAFQLETMTADLATGSRMGSQKSEVTISREGADGSGWVSVRQSIEQARPSMLVGFELTYSGLPVARKEAVILSTQSPARGLSVEGLQLVDSRGRSVVLSVADVRPAAPRRLRRIGERPVRIVVMDDSLSPPELEGGASSSPSDGGYLHDLRALLEARAGGKRIEIKRLSGAGASQGLRPPARFCALADEALPYDPDIVVLCASTIDVMDCVPPVMFESYLTAMADQILTQSEAVPVLATPLPIVGNPYQSRPYAVLVKRVGLRKQVAVADLYSRYLLTGRQWPELFRIGGGTECYWMWPGRQGQAIIAQELAATLEPILKGKQ